MKKLLFTLIACLTVLSVNALDTIYLVGTGTVDGQTLPGGPGASAVAVNGNNNVFTFVAENIGWLKMSDRQGTSWDDFNNNGFCVDNYWENDGKKTLSSSELGKTINIWYGSSKDINPPNGDKYRYTLTVRDKNSSNNSLVVEKVIEEVVTYPETLFVIGTLEEGQWDTSKGIECKTANNGVYTFEDVVMPGEGGYAYFSFCEQLSNSAGDWSGIGIRYGADNDKYPIESGKSANISKSGNAFMGGIGVYSITVDLKEGTMTASWEPIKIETYPEELFLIGNLEESDYVWDPMTGIKGNKTADGIFEWTNVVINDKNQNAYFSFCTQLATSPGNEGGWNQLGTRYGGESGEHVDITSGTPIGIYPTGTSFNGEPGTYNIKVDFTQGTMTATWDPLKVETYPEELYLIGNLEESGYDWSPNSGIRGEKISEGVYEWEDVVINKENQGIEAFFSFTEQLSEIEGDWDNLGTRYGGKGEEDVVITSGVSTDIIAYSQTAYKGEAGIYNITVDLTEGTVTATWVRIYPEELYLIGTIPAGNWDPTKGVKSSSSSNGVYNFEDVEIYDGTGNAFFSFCTQLAPENVEGAWKQLGIRYGGAQNGENSDVVITNGGEAVLTEYDDPAAYKGEAGVYTITVDIPNHKMTATWTELPPGPEKDWYFNLIGTFNNWDTNLGKKPIDSSIVQWNAIPLYTKLDPNDTDKTGQFEIKIFDGKDDHHYGTNSEISLNEWVECKKDCEKIWLNDGITGENPDRVYQIEYNTKTNQIRVTDEFYLVSSLTDPEYQKANRSYIFTNDGDDSDSYSLNVASISNNETFYISNGIVNLTIGELDMVEKGNLDLVPFESSNYSGFRNSLVDVTFTLILDGDHYTLMWSCSSIRDNNTDLILTLGNDKTMQSGQIGGSNISISVATGQKGALLYVHSPKDENAVNGYKQVYYKLTPDMEKSGLRNVAAGHVAASFDETTGAHTIALPIGTGSLSLDYDDNEADEPATYAYSVSVNDPLGVDGIEAEEGEAEYFTLQGVKLNNAPEKGIYIKVVGGKAVKVVR